MKSKGALVAFASCAWTLRAVPVHADRAAEADQLFREGVAHMKADNCPVAVAKFLSSQQLEGSAGTLVNIGACYARLGRTGSAFRTFYDAQDAATKEGNVELRQRATTAITRLRPLLTKLQIVPPHGATLLSLKLDGEPISPSDGAAAIDPGEHILEAVVLGRQSWRHRVVATEQGATMVIEIPDLAPTPGPEQPADWRTGAVIVGGLGLASLAAGSIFAVSAKMDYDRASDDCSPTACTPTGASRWHDAQTKATTATVVVGLGALMTAAGMGLWIASPARRSTAIVILPWTSAHSSGMGVALEGTL